MEDRYIVVLVDLKSGDVTKRGPFHGDEGADTAARLADKHTHQFMRGIVVGLR